jgi:hypothetical protein
MDFKIPVSVAYLFFKMPNQIMLISTLKKKLKKSSVFGPPGFASGSVSQMCGFGCGSFNHQAKIIIKKSKATKFFGLAS